MTIRSQKATWTVTTTHWRRISSREIHMWPRSSKKRPQLQRWTARWSQCCRRGKTKIWARWRVGGISKKPTSKTRHPSTKVAALRRAELLSVSHLLRNAKLWALQHASTQTNQTSTRQEQPQPRSPAPIQTARKIKTAPLIVLMRHQRLESRCRKRSETLQMWHLCQKSSNSINRKQILSKWALRNKILPKATLGGSTQLKRLRLGRNTLIS